MFAREGQFVLDPFAFQKQAFAMESEKWLCKTEQPVQRSAGAGGHDIDQVRRHRLDAARPKRHGRLGNARRFAQEGAFSQIGFDQLDAGYARESPE